MKLIFKKKETGEFYEAKRIDASLYKLKIGEDWISISKWFLFRDYVSEKENKKVRSVKGKKSLYFNKKLKTA